MYHRPLATAAIILATALFLSHLLPLTRQSTSSPFSPSTGTTGTGTGGMSPPTPIEVASRLLAPLNLTVRSATVLQTLWAGYGHICALEAVPSSPTPSEQDPVSGSNPGFGSGPSIPLILKLISPPKSVAGREGQDETQDEGHLRKMLSYQVEQYFYARLAPHLHPETTPVARCLASTYGNDASSSFSAAGEGAKDILDGGAVIATVMEDLRVHFPVAGGKRDVLTPTQVHAALDWLATFHASSRALYDPQQDLPEFLLPPLQEAKRRRQHLTTTTTTTATTNDEKGKDAVGSRVWLNGGYTYLSTRLTEYASLRRDRSSEWSPALTDPSPSLPDDLSPAEAAARVLAPRGHHARPAESLIHGDVKSENLFSNAAGDRVAFYDFQYVGLGLGVCDLAKLFTCSVPMQLLLTESDGLDGDSVPMGEGEKALLRRYRGKLLSPQGGAAEDAYPWDDFVRHWETALVDWCRFQASWGFWGNTEWLEARVRFILADDSWVQWVKQDLLKAGKHT
ncbi:hypothetical protein N3K66_006413 [Trichothecium roseum]|uniref:Uncharacterized protein n=1 Tax=Trichothecium roseum TaxID=47278 RepID=A0ACC0UXU8_9HYPO|nr:hypothetical protein N3K66_006413 [Trichothecium roseum]